MYPRPVIFQTLDSISEGRLAIATHPGWGRENSESFGTPWLFLIAPTANCWRNILGQCLPDIACQVRL
jgi:hypothetical protein